MSGKVSRLPIAKPVIKAPKHLSRASKQFYEQTVADFVLENHHLKLLQALCEAWDRKEQARKILDEEGLTTEHPKLGKRPHPAISIERDCRTQIARLLRELNLSDAPEDPI